MTDVAHLLREILYRLEVLDWHSIQSKGPAPKRIELPKSAKEAKTAAAKQATKAEAHAARQARAQRA